MLCMSGRVTKRRGRTVAQLLDAAYAVFVARGVGACSIGDICSAAGLTRGAFYSNFAGKEELFFALYAREQARMAALIDEQVQHVLFAADPVGELAARIVALGGDAYRPWFLITLEFTLLGARDVEAGARLALVRAETGAMVAELLARCLHEAGREPITSAADLAGAVMASFLGWQTVRVSCTGSAVDELDQRTRVRLIEQLTSLSRPLNDAG